MTTDHTDGWHEHRTWDAPERSAGHPARSDPPDRLHASSRWPSWLLDTVKHRQRIEPPTRADALAAIALPDQEGRSVLLGDLWRDRPAVLVWLRQFGCPFCRSYARLLNEERVRFDDARATIVLIGQGTPVQAAAFRRSMRIDLPVLADEARSTYGLAGTKLATLDELIGPEVVAKGLIAMARHHVFLGRNTADEAQLGGSIVVAPGGQIVFAHLSDNASDVASADELLRAVRGAPSG
jgi:peroxiredoxin